ncbi:hypothetical protein OIO90_004273 [Microbotryomycetes sp. JL221]|nr:hypothetical protein OIO90_004273 [Microbotryomycetes sp. JL221]
MAADDRATDVGPGSDLGTTQQNESIYATSTEAETAAKEAKLSHWNRATSSTESVPFGERVSEVTKAAGKWYEELTQGAKADGAVEREEHRERQDTKSSQNVV